MAIVLNLLAQLDISGYVETRPYFFWNDSSHVSGYNRGWLEFKTDGFDYGTQVALDLIIPYDTTSFANVIEDINISRLCLWMGPENTRLIAGKQRLYWGVARVFRPLDIFNPVNYFEPGYEKAGSNAILGYVSLGSLTSIRGIYIPDYDIERSFTGIRLGTNLLKNDIGFSAMHRSLERRTIIGGEITGELILGYWSEFSYTFDETLQYSRLSIGVDYTFPFMVYTMAEYFFDGSGEDDPANYDSSRIFSGERVTLAQQYLYLTIGAIYNPFFRPAINSLINLNDRSFIIMPMISYELFENVEITSGFNYFVGSDESEFKQITPFDGQVYIWGKVYF